MAGTCSHLCTCFGVERMKTSTFRRKKERERERARERDRFPTAGRNGPVSQSGVVYPVGTVPNHPPLNRRDTKLNTAAQDAGNRQFLVFYTTAYTVQFRSGGAGGDRAPKTRRRRLEGARRLLRRPGPATPRTDSRSGTRPSSETLSH